MEYVLNKRWLLEILSNFRVFSANHCHNFEKCHTLHNYPRTGYKNLLRAAYIGRHWLFSQCIKCHVDHNHHISN